MAFVLLLFCNDLSQSSDGLDDNKVPFRYLREKRIRERIIECAKPTEALEKYLFFSVIDVVTGASISTD